MEQDEHQHQSNEGLGVAGWDGVAEARVSSRSLNMGVTPQKYLGYSK